MVPARSCGENVLNLRGIDAAKHRKRCAPVPESGVPGSDQRLLAGRAGAGRAPPPFVVEFDVGVAEMQEGERPPAVLERASADLPRD